MAAATALKHAAMRGDAAVIVARGAIPPLVALLNDGVRPALQDEAAAALRALCTGSAPNRSAICSAGAVPPLVALLGSAAPETQEQAAGLLGSLAMHADGVAAILAGVGVAPLVSVCCVGCSGAKLDAVHALRCLSAYSPESRAALRDAGAVPVLQALEQEGPRPAAAAAAAALELLARTPEQQGAQCGHPPL